MLDAVMHSLPMNGGTCGKFMTMNRLEVELAFVGLLLAVIALTIPPLDKSVKIRLPVRKRDQGNRWLTSSSNDENCSLCSRWVLRILEVNNSPTKTLTKN